MLNVLKRDYEFTITEDYDEDFMKYIQRKLRPHAVAFSAHGERVDISLDDAEGDVVAGIAGYTREGWLYIEMLWVSDELRGLGIGRRLVQMAEDIATQRGCHQARANTPHQTDFYAALGYVVGGSMIQFPSGTRVYWLCKDLDSPRIDDSDTADAFDKIIG